MMINTKNLSSTHEFLLGLFIGLVVMFLLIFSLNLSGLVVLTGSLAELGNQMIYWLVDNLGWSIVFFSLVLLLYFYYLFQLKQLLSSTDEVPASEIEEKSHQMDKLISLFFGVGVLYTAIGMRSALTAALGNLDGEMASSLGAWEILSRLVDGGILLALSTTIVGGAGGYLMSLIKQWLIDKPLIEFYYQQEQQSQNAILDKLDEMLMALSPKDKSSNSVHFDEPY